MNKSNKRWRERWLDVIKYDQDWDWSYLMKIIMRKLTLIKARWDDPTLVMVADEERIPICHELDRLITLGEEILSDENQLILQADDIAGEHCHSFLRDEAREDGVHTYLDCEWDPKDGDPDGWKKEYVALLKKGGERKQHAVDQFFDGLGKLLYQLWD